MKQSTSALDHLNHGISSSKSWGWGFLILQGLMLSVYKVMGHGFDLRQLPDSKWYLGLETIVFSREALTSDVTLGYPLFLHGIRFISPDLSLLPPVQFVLWFLVAGLWYWTWLRCGMTAMLSLALSSSILYFPIGSYFQIIEPDLLGLTFAVGAVALLLHHVKSGSIRSALGASIFVAASWFLRPAYLFLLPGIPILGVCLELMIHPDFKWKQYSGKLIRMLILMILPILIFCGFRWVMVGKFGLVSSGGINLIGITGQFLEPEHVDRLPEDLRPLAHRILELRKIPSDERGGSLGRGVTWRSPCLGRWGVDVNLLQHQYNDYIWAIALFHSGAKTSKDFRKANSDLARLSMAMIGLSPMRYVTWLTYTMAESIGMLPRFFLNIILIVLGGGLLVLHILLRLGGYLDSKFRWFCGEAPQVLKCVFTLFAVFFLLKTALVVSVERPDGRYIFCSAIFSPWMLVTIYYFWIQALVKYTTFNPLKRGGSTE